MVVSTGTNPHVTPMAAALSRAADKPRRRPSVLTLGAVVAFAASFAAQSIIKDVSNGFLILAEDQYAIGDIVAIGSESGVVENLTLRVTQLRNDEVT